MTEEQYQNYIQHIHNRFDGADAELVNKLIGKDGWFRIRPTARVDRTGPKKADQDAARPLARRVIMGTSLRIRYASCLEEVQVMTKSRAQAEARFGVAVCAFLAWHWGADVSTYPRKGWQVSDEPVGWFYGPSDWAACRDVVKETLRDGREARVLRYAMQILDIYEAKAGKRSQPMRAQINWCFAFFAKEGIIQLDTKCPY